MLAQNNRVPSNVNPFRFPLREILLGLLVQGFLFWMVWLWFTAHPVHDASSFPEVMNAMLVVGAFLLSGPLTAFLTHRGRLEMKLYAVACYLAVCVILFFGGIILVGFISSIIHQ